MVANLVWTTDFSSANSSATRWRAAAPTGVRGSAVTATVSVVPTRARASSTSVVVPERVRATTRSYRRSAGNSEAAKASVSPSPSDSRSAA